MQYLEETLSVQVHRFENGAVELYSVKQNPEGKYRIHGMTFSNERELSVCRKADAERIMHSIFECFFANIDIADELTAPRSAYDTVPEAMEAFRAGFGKNVTGEDSTPAPSRTGQPQTPRRRGPSRCG
jgi:hypothetical protein